MRYFLLCAMLFSGVLWAQTSSTPKDRVVDLENSPARQRLDEIEEYKPVVRRSRSVAIQELEIQIVKGRLQLENGRKKIKEEEGKMKRKEDDAWTSAQMEQAQQALEALDEYLDEAEDELAIAKREEAKVQKFFAREKDAGRIKSSGAVDQDEENDDDDEDDEADEDDENSPETPTPAPDSTQTAPPKTNSRSRSRDRSTPVVPSAPENRDEEDN